MTTSSKVVLGDLYHLKQEDPKRDYVTFVGELLLETDELFSYGISIQLSKDLNVYFVYDPALKREKEKRLTSDRLLGSLNASSGVEDSLEQGMNSGKELFERRARTMLVPLIMNLVRDRGLGRT